MSKRKITAVADNGVKFQSIQTTNKLPYAWWTSVMKKVDNYIAAQNQHVKAVDKVVDEE